jgi:hypothetical protein
MLAILKRLRERRAEKKADLAAIATAHDEARRAGDEPERTLSDAVFETYDKYPDGGPV